MDLHEFGKHSTSSSFLPKRIVAGGMGGRADHRVTVHNIPQIERSTLHLSTSYAGHTQKWREAVRFAATPAAAEDVKGWTVTTFMPSEGDEESHGS